MYVPAKAVPARPLLGMWRRKNAYGVASVVRYCAGGKRVVDWAGISVLRRCVDPMPSKHSRLTRPELQLGIETKLCHDEATSVQTKARLVFVITMVISLDDAWFPRESLGERNIHGVDCLD